MEQFKNRPEGFNKVRKQMLIKKTPLMVIAIAVGIYISEYNTNNVNSNVNVLPFIIPIAFLSLGFGVYIGVNRQKKLFESYTLSITNDSIVREQNNTQTIKIAFSDVNEISKNSNGSFTIKGKISLDEIGVSEQINNYQQLETMLNNIRPLLVLTKVPVSQKLYAPLSIVTLGLMAIVYLATNKIAVGISGVILNALLIWALIQIQRNKNIDNKTKSASLWTIIVLLSIIGTMIFKLTAH